MHSLNQPQPPDIKIEIPHIGQAAEILAVRKTVFKDELQLAGICQADIEQHVETWAQPQSVVNYEQTMRERFADPSLYQRIVTIGGEVAGLFVACRAIDDDPNQVSVIQLHQSVRRRGIGTLLLQGFDNFADPTERTVLSVFKGNEPAITFYQKHGFRATNLTTNVPIGSYGVAPMMNMSKPPLKT